MDKREKLKQEKNANKFQISLFSFFLIEISSETDLKMSCTKK